MALGCSPNHCFQQRQQGHEEHVKYSQIINWLKNLEYTEESSNGVLGNHDNNTGVVKYSRYFTRGNYVHFELTLVKIHSRLCVAGKL